MKIEAFSEGKNLDAPEANEDQFLVLPGRGYAVIDGATRAATFPLAADLTLVVALGPTVPAARADVAALLPPAFW